MPASRIAFAISDLVAEVVRLQNRDAKPAMALRLDPESFDRVVHELRQYGARTLVHGAPRIDVNGREPVDFGGVRIECNG